MAVEDGAGVLPFLESIFSGRWSVVRRIRDLGTCEGGRLCGSASFLPENGGLRFLESGTLVLGQARLEARQSYRFVIESEDAFSVYFADGRLFHRARLSAGQACVTHDCAPDIYRGRYRLGAPDRWSIGWRITGPRKNLIIGTVFSRAGLG